MFEFDFTNSGTAQVSAAFKSLVIMLKGNQRETSLFQPFNVTVYDAEKLTNIIQNFHRSVTACL